MSPRCSCGGAALLMSLLSCKGEEKSQATFDLQLPKPEILMVGDSVGLGAYFDLSLDSKGSIWVVDAMNNRLLHLAQDGKLIRTIGRAGDGPGEFRGPNEVAANDTIVRVYDMFPPTIQDYRPNGTHLADHLLPAGVMGIGGIGASALSVDGSVVVPKGGFDSALATLQTVTSSASTRLGPVVVPPIRLASGMAFEELSDAIKAEAKNRRVAQHVRNMITAAIGDRGTVWLLVQSEREVRKYAPEGTLLWRRTLQVPEADSALDHFFRTTVELEPKKIAGWPTTMDAAQEIGETVWILIHGEAEHPSVFYVLDSDSGRVRGRLSVKTSAPARGFKVDPVRRRLYLVIPDEASIYTVDLDSVRGLSLQ
jgi:hypothetical protein